MNQLYKFPRTKHLQGSCLQKGDEDLTQVSFEEIKGQSLVIEEKLDGANAGVSFDHDGNLKLQSRGHFLRGGPRERHWDLFKRWAGHHQTALFDSIGDRYIMYGEWMYAKHTVFYDLLPHFFMEFDVYDKQGDVFLSTSERRLLLSRRPFVSVNVLHEGPVGSIDEILQYIRPSCFKSENWKRHLMSQAINAFIDPDQVLGETDQSDDMEGLYIKVESDGLVKQRLKWVRNTFSNTISESKTHWLDRTIIPNLLASGVDLFQQ